MAQKLSTLGLELAQGQCSPVPVVSLTAGGDRQLPSRLRLRGASCAQPIREISLGLGALSTVAQVLTVTRGHNAPETRAAAERARDLAEKGGNLAQFVLQVYRIWRSLFNAGDYSTAALLTDQILELAKREGSPASFGFACRAQQDVSFFRGDLVGAEEHFTRLEGFLDVPGFTQVPGTVIAAMGHASFCAWALGHADLARERIAQAIAFARDSSKPYELALARTFDCWLSCLLRESQRAKVAATQAIIIDEEHGFPFIRNMTRTMLGWAQAQLGHAGEGVALVHQGLAGLAEAGSRIGITDQLTRLAEAHALDGKVDDALTTMEDALTTIEEALKANPEELVYRPDALTCRGDLRLKVGQTELAEADFREAIALAQKMQSKAWELLVSKTVAEILLLRVAA